MIQHRLAIVVWLVLVLLAGRAVDGKAETLPRSADQAIDHTGDTRPYWTGRIEQDTTWRDTVYVGGDVTIAAAATLTLAPNTQVLFLPYRDDARGGLDTTRAELIVEGRLAAQAGGIVFRSADAGSLGADWYGLVVEQGGRADVSNAAIRDGLRCLYAKRGGRVRMDAIAFANCGKPIAPADAAKLAKPRGTERKEELGLVHQRETKITPPMNQPFERQEITIHIRGEHKAVISALLAAADEGTPVTGIAELDSLAVTYGLMGIYRKGRVSPFYGSRFRLTFPLGTDVVAIAGDYGNVPYIQSIETENRREYEVWQTSKRIGSKLIGGTFTGVVAGGVLARIMPFGYYTLLISYPVGTAVGVSASDLYDRFLYSLSGSLLGAGGSILLINKDINILDSFIPFAISSSFMATLASELSRKSPESRHFGRLFVVLVPGFRGSWSAVTTLQF